MRRRAWERYLQDRPEVRYLYGRGAARLETEVPALSQEDERSVRNFLNRLRDQEDLRALGRTYLLLQPSLQEFVTLELPGLLRSLERVMRPRIETTRGAPRGKIQWSSTFRRRVGGKADSTTFVVRKPERSADLPENRLVKLFLRRLVDTVDAAAVAAGTRHTPAYLQELRSTARRLAQEPHLRGVETVDEVDANMRRAARRNRDPRYGKSLDFADQHDDVVHETRWRTVLELLRVGWLEPLSDDDLFELYSLVFLFQMLSERLGYDGVSYGLIRAGREEVAVFEHPTSRRRVRVWFDQNPARIFKGRSRYRNVIGRYSGIVSSGRRPDIVLAVERRGQADHRFLLEVKRTTGGEYQRDSVYKGFGYLYDFRELWADSPAQTPKIGVLFPGDTRPLAGTGWLNNELVCVSAENPDQLTAVMNKVGA